MGDEMQITQEQKKVAENRTVLYEMDGAHSGAHFSVRHMMVSNVRGEFSKVSGRVALNAADLSQTSVEAEIDASSIQTREPARDQHLRSGDFFDVARFPSITFKSTSVKVGHGGGFQVAGDLTIRDVTRSVILEVEPLSPETRDPYGYLRLGTSATTKISRSDFGLTWNALLETGGVVVGDEVKITLDIELVRKAE
jgi:polyisoprenoid-binding protein YceI